MNDSEKIQLHACRIDSLTIQMVILGTAFRALLATHPDQKQVRIIFDQMIVQTQTSREMLSADPLQTAALRKWAEELFQPHNNYL